MKRRRLLKIGLGAAGVSALPLSFEALAQTGQTNFDVIVIGAGFAGLSTAHDLTNQGYDVLVLEARDRIGGRVQTDWSLGAPFEYGAGWIHGPKGNPLSALARQAGIKTYITDDDSIEVYDAEGDAVSGAALDAMYGRYKAAAKRIDAELDSDMSLAKAMDLANPKLLKDPLARWYATSAIEFDTGGPLENLSAFYFDADSAFDGTDVIPLDGYDKLLGPLSGDYTIMLNAIADRVEYENGDGASVYVGDTEYESDFVVCTVPLGVLQSGAVAFNPALPKPIRTAISKIPMGSVTKLALKFDTAFWPVDVQYFGALTDEKGRWPYIFNYRTFSNANILMPLSFGAYAFAADAMNDADIVADAMDVLRGIFGTNIPDPSAMLATRWSQDQFTRGAYSYAGLGSTPQHFDAFAKPVEGTLFFAGEHTDFAYHGTVHGALLSGRRAAAQVWDFDE